MDTLKVLFEMTGYGDFITLNYFMENEDKENLVPQLVIRKSLDGDFLSIVPSTDDDTMFEVSEFSSNTQLRERCLYTLEELPGRIQRFMEKQKTTDSAKVNPTFRAGVFDV